MHVAVFTVDTVVCLSVNKAKCGGRSWRVTNLRHEGRALVASGDPGYLLGSDLHRALARRTTAEGVTRRGSTAARCLRCSKKDEQDESSRLARLPCTKASQGLKEKLKQPRNLPSIARTFVENSIAKWPDKPDDSLSEPGSCPGERAGLQGKQTINNQIGGPEEKCKHRLTQRPRQGRLGAGSE